MFARTDAQHIEALGTNPALSAARSKAVLGALPYLPMAACAPRTEGPSTEINLGIDTAFWGRKHQAVAPMLAEEDI